MPLQKTQIAAEAQQAGLQGATAVEEMCQQISAKSKADSTMPLQAK
jgi:hypothetical protein